jgi:hypothetical protein
MIYKYLRCIHYLPIKKIVLLLSEINISIFSTKNDLFVSVFCQKIVVSIHYLLLNK